MFVKLARYAPFPEYPNWVLINEDVPLGTQYEVIGYRDDGVFFNDELGYKTKCDVFLLRGNGDQGWLPTKCFEEIAE